MKAVIRLDVPEWQIGQEVHVIFRDTMEKHGICDAEQPQIVRCKDCRYSRKTVIPYLRSEQKWCNRQETHHPFDWYCADGERKESK